MFLKKDEFLQNWKIESASTVKLFECLTDESLNQEMLPGGRTLGMIVWHIATTMEEMVSRTGLKFEAAKHTDPVPTSATEIVEAYKKASLAVYEAIEKQWTDEDMAKTSDMYGQQWVNGQTLAILINHEIHHRGQMTILMRQAGVKVAGMYGPTKEEWAMYGMEEPAF